MANRKITEFTALTAPAATDVLPIIDQSESGADKNKKIAYSDVLSKAPAGSASAPAFSFTADQDTGISGGSNTLTLSTGGTGRLTIASDGKVTIANDLQVNGTTTTIDSTTLTVKDKNIEIAKGNGNDAAVDGAGITVDSTDGDKTWNWVDSTDAWTSSEHIDLVSGKVLKVAGTQVLSATNFTGTSAIATNVTVADESSDTTCNVLFTTAATGNLPPKSGTNLTFNSSTGALTATSFVGAVSGNATTATTSTNVTVADESTDTTCNVLFVTAATGDLPPKSGTNLTFNSSSGVLTATGFAGDLTGDVTGNVTGNTSGSSGSCTGNAATATALATARAINGVDFDGTAAITVTAAAGTLTGTTLKSTVVNSSLTSVGTLTSLASGAITTTDNLSVDNDKSIRLYEADSNGSAYVGIKGATDKGSESSYTVSLPAAAPTANQILKANASTPTNLEWSADSATDSTKLPLAGGTLTGKVTHNYTSSVRMAVGTTGQRDGSPSVGDFRYNSTNSEFEGYTASGWGAIAGGSSGTDFKYLALRNAANNGAASYPASDFTLVTSGTTNAITPTQANALIVSYGGVIQQPNSGTSTPTTGFAISGSTIKFGSNIAAAPDFIIYQLGAGIGTPSDGTVTEPKLDANAPTNDYVLTADSSASSGFKWAATASAITINNNADNRVITGSGTANTLEGEASFTFDGTKATSPIIRASNGIVETIATISTDYTITSGYNAMSVSPTIASGVTVTVPANSVWAII